MLKRNFTELALGLFLFSLLFTNQAFGSVDYTLNIPAEHFSLERQGEFTKLSLKGGMELNCPGSPSVPQLLIKLILPSGERIESIETNILSSKRLSLGSPLFPCQHPEEISDRATVHPFVGPNMKVYSSSGPYPAKLVELVEEGYWGSNHLVTLAVIPLRYYAAEGVLELINSLQLRIETEPLTAEKQFSLSRFRGLGNPVSPEMLEKVVSNEEDVGRFAAPGAAPKLTSGTAAEYVIITNEALASAFEPLAEWKTQKGVPAKIIFVSEIESSYPGVDTQEKIRNFLMEAYMSGLKWVLLGGDESVVPIRYCYPNDTNTQKGLVKLQITDLYYADFTGDWEVDGDGIWGE
ncbi:MAG: C25 family cysteine peptidase, partial [Candidatus Zixiibacteriota bacterium]